MRRENKWLSGPKAMPLYQSAAYAFPGLTEVETVQDEPGSGFIYARYAHPNAEALERSVAELEGGEDAVVTASGMAAVFCTLATLVRPGDQIIAQRTLYGGTMSLLTDFFTGFGVETTFCAAEPAAVAGAMKDNTKVLIVETISNPLLEVADLAGLSQLAEQNNVALVVDNTFATPRGCRPLVLGATAVIESLTKFLGGHSDLMLGSVAGSGELCGRIRNTARLTGPAPDPFAAWLCGRSLRTFRLRQQAAQDNALAVARFLEQQPGVARVLYPGLLSHDHYDRATALLCGYGAMVSMELDGGRNAADKFIQGLSTIEFVPSLGDVETTVSHPATTSHRALTAEEREQRGIGEGLIRLSIGCEPLTEIKSDLEAALAAVDRT